MSGHDVRVGALVVAALCAFASTADARDAVLTIGTKEAPPFAMKAPDGSWTGISIELWEELADDLGLEYEYRELDLDDLLQGLEDGSLDLVAAALTVTSEREKAQDFSHPYHASGLGIGVRGQSGEGAFPVLRRIVSTQFLRPLMALLVILFAAGVLVWMFERKRNPEQFGGSAARGLGSAFWWSAVTMTTVGYGDKAPLSVPGRLVAIVWMFVSVIVISGFTAAIASSLTVGQLQTGISGPDDLPAYEAATVPESTSEDYLRQHHVRTVPVDSATHALQAVVDGKADVAVYDAPILRHLANGPFRGRIVVLPATFRPQSYAFGLPQGSPLREPLNRVLLETIHSPAWDTTVEQYLGR